MRRILSHAGAILTAYKGCWRDNVFVKRLWRSVEYEEVYHRAYDDGPQAQSGIGDYFGIFKDERPH
jgi:putative transposase